jgi:hypothetical protein
MSDPDHRPFVEDRMSVERHCTMKSCPGGEGCINPHRGEKCVMEYVASDYPEELRWKGDEPPPRRWWADGTLVYRSFADYCD